MVKAEVIEKTREINEKISSLEFDNQSLRERLMKENNYTTRRVDEIEDRLKKMKLK
jgi:hypothetical protein